MTRRAVTFDDFSRGEYGDLGPRLTPDAGPGWFTGKNVMRYRNGQVGPRPGLRKFTRSGASWPNGKVHTMYGSVSALQQVYALIGQKSRQITPNLTTLDLVVANIFGDGNIPEPTTWPSNGQHRTTSNWVIVPADGLYKADLPTSSIVLVDTNLTGRAFKFYRDRQLAAIDSDTYYSGPGPSGWDTFADFFSGTTFNAVCGFFELRNGIAIAQSSPNIDMVTGTIGTSSSVQRRVSSRTGPLDPYACASIASEFLVIMGRELPFPMLYNGATWEELRHLRYAGTRRPMTSQENGSQPAHTVVDLEYEDSWLILCGLAGPAAANRMLLSFNGTRTFHTWGTTIAPYARRFDGGLLMLTDGGAAGAPPEFYAWVPDLDRPGFVADVAARPGDNTDTPLDAYLHLPSWPAEEGQEVCVMGVVVSITRWNTGAALTNHFDLTVDARRRYGQGNPVTSATQTYDEAGSVASAGGDDVMVHLGFGDQGYANEFQLKFNNLRGCAIRAITVILEQRPERV